MIYLTPAPRQDNRFNIHISEIELIVPAVVNITFRKTVKNILRGMRGDEGYESFSPFLGGVYINVIDFRRGIYQIDQF